MSTFIHATAELAGNTKIGEGVKIWHYVQVLTNAEIGENTTIGKGVYIDSNIKIGRNCNIQNNVSIYHGVIIEDNVFVGPHVCFTNNKNPRAVNEHEKIVKENTDWVVKNTLVKKGASIGANSTIIAGVTIGEYALIGGGSVVTRDIPPFALAYGNPVRIHGRVNKAGKKIKKSKKFNQDPSSKKV